MFIIFMSCVEALEMIILNDLFLEISTPAHWTNEPVFTFDPTNNTINFKTGINKI